MAHLGELIAELRQDKGLTQKELGDILCVSSGTISNYENGVHLPDVDNIVVQLSRQKSKLFIMN